MAVCEGIDKVVLGAEMLEGRTSMQRGIEVSKDDKMMGVTLSSKGGQSGG